MEWNGSNVCRYVQYAHICMTLKTLVSNNSVIAADQSVYLSLGNTNYFNNNTDIIVTRIRATNDSSLTCHTDLTSCCRPIHNNNSNMGMGDWLFPDAEHVLNRMDADSTNFYRVRYHQVIRLYRQGDIQAPLGSYCCRILDGTGEMRTFCANLVGEYS